MFGEKSLPRLILITPLLTIFILTAMITTFYVDELKLRLKEDRERFVKEYLLRVREQSLGFVDLESLNRKIIDDTTALEIEIEGKTRIVIGSSIMLAIFASLLSLWFSRRIADIFLEYKKEVKEREEELNVLNRLLERRVQAAVTQMQEKERMLIQSSKMAAMGDMISMIAHQWRQPLNQLSFVFMNIQGAYNHKELSQTYMDTKVKEGSHLLEFMSHTINDFSSFFKADKEKLSVNINDVIEETLSLIFKTLQNSNIEVSREYNIDQESLLYKNEFKQVVLNILQNAQDILVENDIEEPQIAIRTKMDGTIFVVTICDNGGGVKDSIKSKIYEPYFTTREHKQGSGLGLYMSRVIIEDHHSGKLSCTNSDIGACFKITI